MKLVKKFKEVASKGYLGLAVKNSVSQILITIAIKTGGLIFTAIIARVLMPELFGLYSLVFYTIFTFASFSDMGVGTSLTRFVSKALARGDRKKAKAYSVYHFKIKIYLTVIIFLILIISAKFISRTYYQKPIFLALLAGSLFVIILSMIGFIENFFRSTNQFQGIFLKESFFQIARILISPILIISFLKYATTQEISILIIVSSVFLPYLFTLIFFVYLTKKKITFLTLNGGSLTKKNKKEINKFVIPVSISLICYTLIDQIDIILLGKFVTSEFIGYYSAAFSLISPATALATLSTALFPLFSRLDGEQLDRALRKSVKAILLISLSFTLFIIVFAPIIVKIAYGGNYLMAIGLLRIGTLVIIPSTVVGIYVNYLMSKGKTKVTAKLLIILTIIKLVIGYILVSIFIKTSLLAATIGVISSRIVTEYIYWGALIFLTRKKG